MKPLKFLQNTVGEIIAPVLSSAIPTGVILPFPDTTERAGFLICDGQNIYANSDYPELSKCPIVTRVDDTHFSTPDLRELTLVGSGENSTLDIAAHDVYAPGEFKDDQLQTHTHNVTCNGALGDQSHGYQANYFANIGRYDNSHTWTSTQPNSDCRLGTTTHGKQYGIVYFVKT